jgi:hypothetical protein
MKVCNFRFRLARTIPKILYYRTLNSDRVIFLLKCKVTALVPSWCGNRLWAGVMLEHFVCFDVQ